MSVVLFRRMALLQVQSMAEVPEEFSLLFRFTKSLQER
jgi:hypothetical protein